MRIRRRPIAYLGLGIIGIWIFITYYLAVSRSPAFINSKADNNNKDKEKMRPGNDDMDSRSAAKLKEKIDKIEADLSRQKADLLKQKEEQQKHQQQEEELRLRRKQTTVLAGVGPGIIGGGAATAPPTTTTANIATTKKQFAQGIAVIVFACNRPNAIRNHLDQLLTLRPSKEQFPVIVSQDCMHEETTKMLQSYGDKIIFIQHPDQSDITLPPKQKKFLGYYKISRHYRWALNQTFYKYGYKAAIITEDDLDLSVDFFEYFTATYKLLELDPTLYCVSAWNDNGKGDMIEEKPDLLYRTDFFPGLGWMLKYDLWVELEPIWPIAFWDDWMRRPEQRKQRACIRPEVSRTAMSQHGKIGVSKGLYFEKHLKLIKLNNVSVPFTQMDLSYLLKDKYDELFVKDVYSWPSITQAELMSGHLTDGTPLPAAVRLTYEDKGTYKNTAKTLKLMDDFRAGVPRTAYRGVVPFMYGKTRVYLAPPADWKGYDVSWT